MRSQLSQIQQKVSGIKTSYWSEGFLGKGGKKGSRVSSEQRGKLRGLIQIGHLMCEAKVKKKSMLEEATGDKKKYTDLQ